MVSEACPTNPREASGLDPEAVHCQVGDDEVKIQSPPRSDLAPGDTVTIRLEDDRLHLFDRDTGATIYHSDCAGLPVEPAAD